ncbi:MAG TPA: serine/threonine protein kinase [Clostridiales bacterium]|nr:serine/threonine protein kinase [Clostridiales bacterium]
MWFNKYRVIKELGRGGTASVYLAEHIKLNSYRAIKYISNNNPLYDYHIKEAFLLKNLKHSCIPIIYDIEENEYGSYIIEQYIEGITLKEYVMSHRPISECEIISYGLQLCDLILYLHLSKRSIIYIDIKPENIMIADGTLKLIDFGSALYQDELHEEQKYMATRGYSAPEVFANKRADERSDVYGIGMMLYYMVTGRYLTNNSKNISNIDLNGPCSKKLKRIINRCLKYNPSQRYGSVTGLSKHLSSLMHKEKNYNDKSLTLKIALIGSQPRIGVTHLSLQLCRYLSLRWKNIIYEEKNQSNLISKIKSQYDGLDTHTNILKIKGISMLSQDLITMEDNLENFIRVQDYGCLTEVNLKDFIAADIKIMVLGAKDWELYYSEKALRITEHHEDILYFFNFLDGSQFHRVMKSMKHKNCYRIPYGADPLGRGTGKKGHEIFDEVVRMIEAKFDRKGML